MTKSWIGVNDKNAVINPNKVKFLRCSLYNRSEKIPLQAAKRNGEYIEKEQFLKNVRLPRVLGSQSLITDYSFDSCIPEINTLVLSKTFENPKIEF